MTKSSNPPERQETARQALRAALREGECTARDLSQQVRLPEKEVLSHLEHLKRSVERAGERLLVREAECHGCGFTFRRRERLTRPGRCPRCGGGRIAGPRFSLTER